MAPLGRTGAQNRFALEVRGSTAGGRGRVRLESEVKELRRAFDGGGLARGPWTDTGAPTIAGSGVQLAREVTRLRAGTAYRWRLRVASDPPFFPRSPWLTLAWNGAGETDLRTSGAALGIEDPEAFAGPPDAAGAPAAPVLEPAAPNPFNPATAIRYVLPARGRVRLAIHDAGGRVVARLVDRVEEAGSHDVRWDGTGAGGRQAAAGIYLVRLEAAGAVRSMKIALIK